MKHKIKQLLESQGMTQKELAAKAGLTEAGVSRMLASGSATKDSIAKVANALDLTLEEVVVEQAPPKAKYEGVLKIGDMSLPCAVLDNRTRILTQAAVFKALGRPARGNARLTNVPTFMDAKNLQSYITEEVAPMIKRIEYVDAKGKKQTGYNCLILPMVCDMYLKAREDNVLHPSQLASAAHAEVLVRSLAKVGIIALIDEVTGYDKEKNRAKDELQSFLNGFLRKEAARWVKQFDDQFFEDIYKMRHWTWEQTSKRPGVIGTWIKEIVYDRLGPVLPELERRNPKNEHGNRSHKHHQFLSDSVGLPRLKQHLEAVHALAVVANYDWVRFNVYLDKAYPRKFSQLYLDFDYDD